MIDHEESTNIGKLYRRAVAETRQGRMVCKTRIIQIYITQSSRVRRETLQAAVTAGAVVPLLAV